MKWFGMGAIAAAVALSLSACGGSSSNSATTAELQKDANILAINQIEESWHRAASTHNVGLMMSLWAPDATFNIGTRTLSGKAQIRNFFEHTAAPFQPQNQWVAYTPAHRIRFNVNGDRATLYFECLYVDTKGKEIKVHTFSDDNLVRSGGKWLIREMKAGTVPEL